MKRVLIIGLAVAVLTGSVFITSCGKDPGNSAQGFTQSLQKEKEKADEALRTCEQASEALDQAAVEKEAGEQ